jgi:hypothetical protein
MGVRCQEFTLATSLSKSTTFLRLGLVSERSQSTILRRPRAELQEFFDRHLLGREGERPTNPRRPIMTSTGPGMTSNVCP